MDLANEISKQAKRVSLSHHLSKKPCINSLTYINQKPDIKNVLESGAVFCDESENWFSTILLCTGYQYAFPFLSLDCGIQVEDNFVQPLYKHCVNIAKYTMAFIGIPFYVCASQMMDLQARFALAFFAGKKKLPSIYQMHFSTQYEIRKRCKRGFKTRQAHMMASDQVKYYVDLSKTADTQNIFTVLSTLHNESSQRFLEDLYTKKKCTSMLMECKTKSMLME